MNINATLLGQMITFAVFVWFTMKFVWPPVTAALAERQKKIADGLAAADRGQHELVLAQKKSTEHLKEAKLKAQQIIDKANGHANQIIEDSKDKAREEGKRLVEFAQKEIEQEVHRAKDALRNQVASMAVKGAERILGKEIDATVNSELIDKLIGEI